MHSLHAEKERMESWKRAFAFEVCATARLHSTWSIFKNECCQWFNRMLWCSPSLSPLLSLCLTLSSSQIQCKSARAIAMVTESVILACAIASQDSMAWTALKVLLCCFHRLIETSGHISAPWNQAETMGSSKIAHGLRWSWDKMTDEECQPRQLTSLWLSPGIDSFDE